MQTKLSRRNFFEPALGMVMLIVLPGCGGGGDTSLADAAAALGATPPAATPPEATPPEATPPATTPPATTPPATTPPATTPPATTPPATTPPATTPPAATPPATTPPTIPGASSCGAQFDFNHGHVLIIQLSDLNSTTPMSYDITGTADHAHTVTFSVTELAALKAGASVTVTSTTTFAHRHVITVSCV